MVGVELHVESWAFRLDTDGVMHDTRPLSDDARPGFPRVIDSALCACRNEGLFPVTDDALPLVCDAISLLWPIPVMRGGSVHEPSPLWLAVHDLPVFRRLLIHMWAGTLNARHLIDHPSVGHDDLLLLLRHDPRSAALRAAVALSTTKESEFDGLLAGDPGAREAVLRAARAGDRRVVQGGPAWRCQEAALRPTDFLDDLSEEVRRQAALAIAQEAAAG